MPKAIRFTNVGIAINRKFSLIDRMRNEIVYLQKRVKEIDKEKKEMEEKFLVMFEHQKNYLINLENRIIKLESQPSIEGDRLLKVLEDINKKTVFQEVSNESIFGPERIF